MLLNCGAGEDSWSQDQTNQSWRKSTLNIHWKDWCWSSNTLATWCEELTHYKWPWCWERLRAKGEGSDRGWDGWIASLTMDMSLSKLRDMVKERGAWRAAVHGVANRHNLVTEQQMLHSLLWTCNKRLLHCVRTLKYFSTINSNTLRIHGPLLCFL